MKETEKIEIMHFDQEGYLEDGRNVYEAGKRMTALADRVHEEGYDAVFLMGVGGTWDEFHAARVPHEEVRRPRPRGLPDPRRRVERHGPQAHDRALRRARPPPSPAPPPRCSRPSAR